MQVVLRAATILNTSQDRALLLSLRFCNGAVWPSTGFSFFALTLYSILTQILLLPKWLFQHVRPLLSYFPFRSLSRLLMLFFPTGIRAPCLVLFTVPNPAHFSRPASTLFSSTPSEPRPCLPSVRDLFEKLLFYKIWCLLYNMVPFIIHNMVWMFKYIAINRWIEFRNKYSSIPLFL